MKKEDRFNEDINPGGISNEIKNLNSDVWDRGYYLETEDGFWYEVYVNDTIKKYYPRIDDKDSEIYEILEGFNDLDSFNYESDNQITFFVPNDENEYTLDELTDILA